MFPGIDRTTKIIHKIILAKFRMHSFRMGHKIVLKVKWTITVNICVC